MGFRFKKIIKIAPGVKLNISKSGISTSLGGRGATLNLGKRGVMGTVGLPGTGLSYSKHLSSRPSNFSTQSPVNNPIPIPSGLILDDAGKAFFVDDRSDIYPPKQQGQLKRAYPEELQIFLSEKASEANRTTEKIENIQEYFQIPSYFLEIPPVETFPYSPPDSQAILEEVKRRNGFSFFNQQRVAQEADSLYQTAFREYHQNKRDWDAHQMKMQQEFRSILAIKEQAATGDIPSMERLLEKILGNINAPIHFSGSYEVEFSGGVWLDIDLPEIEEIPDTVSSVLKSGAMSTKKKTMKKVKEDYSRLVSGIALILSVHVFTLLPTVETIVISGYTQRRDKATGIINDDYIYSLLVQRNVFHSLNIQHVDPLDSFQNFQPIAMVTNSLDWKTITPYFKD